MKGNKGEPIYDCHHKRYDEVQSELANWIYLNQYHTPLNIMTGNSEKMKTIVRNVCLWEGIRVRESWVNGGVLIIDTI